MGNNPPGRNNEESTEEPQNSSEPETELLERSQVPLEDENYANKLLDYAEREATKVASAEQIIPRPDFAGWAGRRRGSIFQDYFRSIEQHLGYLPTWPPDHTFEPGDVGMLSDGSFIPVSHISAMGHPNTPRTILSQVPDVTVSTTPRSITLRVEEAQDATADDATGASNLSSRVKVRMQGEGASLAHWRAVTVSSIENMESITRSVLGLVGRDEWSRDWVLVTHVMRARSGVILISGAKESSAEFQIARARAGNHSVGLDPIAVLGNPSLRLVKTSGMAGSVVIKEGFTLCFKARRVRRGFLKESEELVRVAVWI